MVFLGLKGFGDLTILLNFVSISNSGSHVLIVRKDLESLAKKLLPNNCRLIVLKHCAGVFPLYNLRVLSFVKILTLIRSSLEIYKILLQLGDSVLVDNNDLRSRIFFAPFTAKTFLSEDKNIYRDLSDIFGFCVKIYPSREVSNRVLVFPFSSLESKDLDSKSLKKIVDRLKSNNIQHKIMYFSGFKVPKDFDSFSLSSYSTIDELLGYFNSADSVLSVDTFQLHLAVFYGKQVFSIGKINSRFRPHDVPPFNL